MNNRLLNDDEKALHYIQGHSLRLWYYYYGIVLFLASEMKCYQNIKGTFIDPIKANFST